MNVARVLPRGEYLPQPGPRVAGRSGVPPVLRVLPRGSRPARSQGSWVRTVEAHPDLTPLRADAQRNLRALVWELARWANWDTPTSRPTWSRLGTAAGLSRSTVAKWLAWLRARDLLAVVEHGSTPRFRPAVLADHAAGNLASVYLLCEPAGDPAGPEPPETPADSLARIFPGDRTRTPPQHPSLPCRQTARARTRPHPAHRNDATTHTPGAPAHANAPDGDIPQPRNHKNAATKGETGTKIGKWPLWQPAHTRAHRLALCHRLQDESPPLRATGSSRRLRHLLRPWLLAGWTPRGLLYAIDHAPNSAPWPYAWRSIHELRNPAGWLLHRLHAWRDQHGQPLPDPYATETSGSTQRRTTKRDSPVVLRYPADPAYVRGVAARLRVQLRQRHYQHGVGLGKSPATPTTTTPPRTPSGRGRQQGCPRRVVGPRSVPRVARELGSGMRGAVRRMLRAHYDGATTSTETLTAALETLRGLAETLHPVPVHRRCARHGDGIYLDLGRDDGQIVVIFGEYWEVRLPASGDPVFVRGAGMRPLPIPERVARTDEEVPGVAARVAGPG